MAREVIEKLIDDLDGGDASETVAFGLDGASYEIDLSKKNAAVLRKALERYVRVARHQGGSRPSTRRTPKKASNNGAKPKRGFDLGKLREWAAANDITVPSRGRIPQAVVAQYKSSGGR